MSKCTLLEARVDEAGRSQVVDGGGVAMSVGGSSGDARGDDSVSDGEVVGKKEYRS